MVSSSRTRGFGGGGLGFGRRTPVILALLIGLPVIYVLSGILLKATTGFATLYGHLALDFDRVLSGEVWQLVTYGLLHNLRDPFHLIWNCFFLYMFGRTLELTFGRARFVGFILAAVIAGGLCVVVAGVTGIGIGSAVGISAACQAIIVTWALRNRDAQLYLFFAVPVRGIWMIAFSIVLWVLDASSFSQTSAAAHLGGILVGLFVGLDAWGHLQRRLPRRRPNHLVVVQKSDDRWVN